MTTLFEKLMAECKAIAPTVIGWRRHFHENPELSFKEVETAAFITSTLQSFACPELTITHPTPTSIVATLKGKGGEGPMVALRADIDALPLNEETDEPFKSRKPGVMHACGHDAHTAMQMGAARILCSHVQHLKGSVRFVFQHAEELLPGGASELVARGVMQGVHSIFGIHVVPQIPTGVVAVKPGILSSCTDSFTLLIQGHGGHASNPHLLVDPIPIAAEVVMAVQTIVSRKIDPKLIPVISIPTMTTGPNETHNVIPDEVKLMGTIRCQDKGVREQVPAEIERIAKGICDAHGGKHQFILKRGYDMVDNNPVVTELVHNVALKIVGTEKRIFVPKDPSFGGEDFSGYQSVVPGCFIGLGIGNKAKNTGESLHCNKFRVDEDGLSLGVCMHVGFVLANLTASPTPAK